MNKTNRKHGTTPFTGVASKRLKLRVLLSALFFLIGNAVQAQTNVTIDGAGTGQVFEGVGAVSSGGTSRLLKDYEEPYRSQILDYLFKPNFGASLQHLKVEIGGDENSGDGAEPTHMRSATDQNYTRGYEFWLMQQAQSRNSAITLDGLEWGSPSWIGGGQFYSQDNINYVLNFIKGARSTYGFTIEDIGIWDESPYDSAWIKNLKSALQTNGLSTRIVAADECCGNQWRIANDMLSDGGLMSAVDVIGEHYTASASSTAAQSTGKPLWDSEDGPWRSDWIGAQSIARTLLANYPSGRMTKTELWALLTSYYSLPTLRNAGLMHADTPWSGSYTVDPPIWAVAHVTQFAQPGWRYIDGACGTLTAGPGTYITLQAPNGTDYSTILETSGAYQNQTVIFTVKNGLSAGTVHVWKSDEFNQFIQQDDIVPVGGMFSITLSPNSIYSLTTTTGQNKGNLTAPPSAAFPFPYADSFEQYALGSTPQYFSDFAGAFETVGCAGSRGGFCLGQMVSASPIAWPGAATGEPATFIGDVAWTDYQLSVDTLFAQIGSTVKLYGRVGGIRQLDGYLYGYQLSYDTTGRWQMEAASDVLLSGTVQAPALNTWHSLKFVFSGPWIAAVIDGTTVGTVYDTTFTTGLSGLGTSWSTAQFDNFSVDFVGASSVTVVPESTMLAASQSQQFTASGTSGQVSWSITPNVGTIASDGLYTAPQSVALGLTVTVTATSLADNTKSGTAVITLAPPSPPVITQQPADVAVDVNQTAVFSVTASGLSYQWQSMPVGATAFSSIPGASSSSYTTPPAIPGDNGTQFRCLVTNGGGTVTSTSAVLTVVTGTAFVVSGPAGTARNNFTGWVGLAMITSANSLNVSAIGRLCTTGNSGIHVVKFVDSGSGGDVPGGLATVNMLGCIAGQFVYAPLPSPITLQTNTQYFLVSQESNGGDQWHDQSAISSTNDAIVSSSVYSSDALSWTLIGGTSTSYVSPNFLYAVNSATQYLLTASASPAVGGSIAANPSSSTGFYDSGTQVQLTALPNLGCAFTNWSGALSGSANPQMVTISGPLAVTANFSCSGPPQTVFVTGYALTSPILRNNFSGWVGMKLTTGANSLSVSWVGRVCVAGDSGSHTVKFVNAGTGTDVPGASAVVNLLGCTAGQFVYVALSGPVTLQANASFYVVSQEFNAGDPWYDFGPISSASDAAVKSSVYSSDGVNWNPLGTANTSYVPPNFLYSLAQAPASIAITVQANPSSASFNVDGTNYTGVQVFSWVAGSSHTIDTTSAQSAGTGAQYAWSSWSDGGGISHTVSPISATTFTSNFTTQYLLSTNVLPVGGGGIAVNPTSSTGYYDSGTQVQLTISANPICTFVNWGGFLSGSASPQMVTLSGPVSVSANFQCSGPASTNFLTGYALNSPLLRNNFSGWVGMKITVGASPLSISSLGRICVAGNSGSHTLKFVNASTGTDVPGGSTSLNLSGCTPNQFFYTALPTPITLQANATYYLASQELNAGDSWYDTGLISTNADAGVKSSIYSFDSANWLPVGTANTSYVPVDFQYSLAPADPTFVTGYNLNNRSLRSDFSGWVGMEFTVGASGMVVNSLGRIFVAGNSGVHTVKLVHASDGSDVGGALVTVSMAGGTAGQFSYTQLASPVILAANSSYYLVSQEVFGGDQWYDFGTVSTTASGVVNNAVYSTDSTNWIPIGGLNSSYVPPNLK